ncbi:DUF4041 domain-containing protein [Rhodopseudomonas parapalustris]
MAIVVFVLVTALFLLPFILGRMIIKFVRERRRRRDELKGLSEQLAGLEERLRPIIDIQTELDRLDKEVRARVSTIEDLKRSCRDKKESLDRLTAELDSLSEKNELAQVAMYEPHFDFSDSEQFRRAIRENRAQQKAMVRQKSAVICTTGWSLEGSEAKGQLMTDRAIKLTLRAFNNECDAAIANVRWNNVETMEKRILNAQLKIDELNSYVSVLIAREFLNLKLKELYLTHEYREKLKLERDKRAELARAAREEQKLLRDLERAEDDQDNYQRLLDKSREEAARAMGPRLEALKEQIRLLENNLSSAQAKVNRAQAMAEMTRSGYVYVISNYGSFGPDVVKIGLTRRLDPNDRIRELGDASVPFPFDTHAIIYSDDAPTLEGALHERFEAVRVNTENDRKEFFRATLDQVENAVRALAPNAIFFRDIEAQEYRETLMRRTSVLNSFLTKVEVRLPVAV